MRKPMKLDEFIVLLRYIDKYHSFRSGGKKIKYVEPVFDTRTRDIFCVQFRGFHDKTFAITNENADRDLKEWIYSWLDDWRD